MSSPAANIHLRSSLVLQEPLNVRSPIYGQFHGLPPPDPRCSLADALAPLLQAIQSGQVADLSLRELQAAITFCHNNGTVIKQIRDKDKPCRLTVAGIAAINLYTCEFASPKGQPQFYSVLNNTLRDANRAKCTPFVPYIWLLMHALRDCPVYPKKVVLV